MPIAVHQPTPAIMEALRGRQIAAVATVALEGTPLASCDLRRPVAVMLGAEGGGLPPEALDAADTRLTIPMRPPVESLNVAITAALILFEASRQRERH
jgi:tRNA G18 (ribose-2'-O)-methylase SpoU